ncbi:COPII coat Sec23p-Sfb3p heterodimer component [Friedmanniomyces endolithicus]|nr:COPII coat Sec23p-Sfb3p heterodimer component [Friedmanniomyces endolithicus]
MSVPTSDGYFPPMQQPHQAPTTQPGTPQTMYGQPGQQDAGGVAQQMGQLNLDGSAPMPTRKKKDRHAYHQLEQPASAQQPYEGVPSGQFLNGQAGQSSRGSSPAPQAWQQPSQPWQTQQMQRAQQPRGTPISMGGQMGQQPGGMSAGGGAQARVNPDQIPSPLAKQADGEQAIPVLDFGETGPPRCRRCRAYINPFMVFSNGGNRMTCNLCAHPNDVPPEYFAPTDPSGVRVDRATRPELLLGTCEFLVPKEYWSKEPVPMRYLFLLDVSAEAYGRGFLQGVCDSVHTAIYGDERETTSGDDTDGEVAAKLSKVPAGAKVGFMTFDREIHFYDVSAGVTAPQELVVSDLDDPFAAISPERLFVDASECRNNITTLLKRIPAMFANIGYPAPVLLPSLNAALSALELTGGKIICSLATLPTFGPGQLHPRDKSQGQTDDGDQSKEFMKAEHPGYKKCQADLVKAGVAVDFFFAAPMGGYLDIATIGFVAEKTGGETYYYPNWSYPRDCLRLEKELTHTLRRDQGYAALMKVRCSNGLQVAHYSGSFTQHTFGADLELASITQDSGMSVTFAYDGKLDPKLDAHFQAALLYTTTSGERRVRCINVVASVTDNARESMRFVDQDAVISVMAKESAAKVGERNLKDIRQALQDKSIDILAGYRKNVSDSHPSGQLVLPENLKEFAMYMLGLVKSRALKAGREPSDRRIQEVRMIKSMGPGELSLYLYPRIIAVHGLDPTEGFADENGHLKMPHAVRASFSQMEEGGAYLVDNGQILLLWLHQQVSPNLLEDLFGEGMDSLQALDPNLSALPVLETHLNAQVRNILLHLEEQRGSKGLAIQLARQGLDGAEFEFARLLYEDRGSDASSYVDWLVTLHRGVGSELSGQRAKASEDVSQTITNTISSITGSIGLH